MPDLRPVPRLALAGLCALLAGTALLTLPPPPAGATVTHLIGYPATVDGFTSWYGSYGMGLLGTAWCIDHGIKAPDPDLRYVPADLSAVPAATQAAMAWVVGAHGGGEDPVAHAAVMLVLHDLMGAVYPSGPIDVDVLTVDQLAGFGGQEGAVLTRARWLKADGLAHQDLRGPLQLSVELRPRSDARTGVEVRLADAEGRPVAGIAVHLGATPGALATSDGITDADGGFRVAARSTSLPLTVTATATVPSPVLDAWEPTAAPAQRVARPHLEALSATAIRDAVPPTTTTTTTTTPPTTTTSTTIASTTTTTTGATTTTAVPAPTTTVAVALPPTTVPTPPALRLAVLPRTGSNTMALTLIALGLVLLGLAALGLTPAGASSPRPRGHHDRGGATRRR